MDIENRVDRVSLTGDLVLSRDKAGLALAKELQLLIDGIVKALEADSQLPETIALKPARIVKNPFT